MNSPAPNSARTAVPRSEAAGDRFWARLGVQSRSFRALVFNYLLIDLRAQTYAQATNSKPGDAIPPLYWVVSQFLALSLLLCAVLTARVPAEFLAATHLLVTAVMVFSAVLVEFHEALFSVEDFRVLGHRPVTDRTWAFARLTNLGVYIGLVTLSLTIFPTIVGASQPDAAWSWGVLYPVASLSVAMVATAVALLVARTAGTPLEGLRRIASWVQIIGILVLFYGGQLMLRKGSGELEMLASRPPTWFGVLPTTWLGGGVARGASTHVIIAALFALVLSAMVVLRLAASWRGVAHVVTIPRRVEYAPLRIAHSLSESLRLGLIGDRTSRTLAALTSRVFARDGDLRTRVYATLALPVAGAVLGVLTDQYAAPGTGTLGQQVPSFAVPMLFAVAVVQGLIPLLSSRDHAAAWRLHATWGPEARRGVVSYLLFRVYLPIWGLHALLVAGLWGDALAAVEYAFVGWGMVLVTAHLAARRLLSAPILCRSPRLGSGAVVHPVTLLISSMVATAIGALWSAVSLMPGGGWLLGVTLFVGGHIVARMR